MKRVCSLLLACALCAFCAGCSQPDALTLDLSQGYGRHTKLIHLNASSAEKEARLQAFYQVLEEANPLEKTPPSLHTTPITCWSLPITAQLPRQWWISTATLSTSTIPAKTARNPSSCTVPM